MLYSEHNAEDDRKSDTLKTFDLRGRVFAHLFYITSHLFKFAYFCFEDGGICFAETLAPPTKHSVSARKTTVWLYRRATPHFMYGDEYCVSRVMESRRMLFVETVATWKCEDSNRTVVCGSMLEVTL